ncbi:S-adenosyl-L-methionine-dependent methyltransferase [Aulographum hederae CBS 113979]|uniref:S-adenosyl-L-methionine-dependent methyltransferase n=1 Tax=Aulographum hederae CBS 113979 TaxID=1176131 RepID=A0A6G1GX80_9PEZI|nr:S-adenosyl-L-methionine-dependent methyltransferase [Aulographum hederae CBS 113979]
MKSKSLQELADSISASAKTLTDYLTSNNLAQPTFEVGAPQAWPELPLDVMKARSELCDASKLMNILGQGNRTYLTWMVYSQADYGALQWLSHFNIADHIPLDKVISYADVAKCANVDEAHLRRLARNAIANNIFCEPRPGHLAHNSVSTLLRSEEQFRDLIAFILEDNLPWTAKLSSAYERWGKEMGSRMNMTAVNVAEDMEEDVFSWMARDQELMTRFAGMMRAHMETEGHGVELFVKGFDWEGVGGGTVVDVGGGFGHISITLAKEFPKLSFVVQDLPSVIPEAEVQCPADVKDRVSFQVHDFWHENPVKDAEIYILKSVLHDWNDVDSTKLIKNILPAMKPGVSKLLIVDGVVPDPGTCSLHDEKPLRTMDILMMINCGAVERETDGWKRLVEGVDDRLKVKNIIRPPGALNSVIEVTFS